MPDVVMSSLYDVDEPELLVLPTLFPQLDDVVSTVRRQCRGGLGIEILEFRNCNPSPLEIP
jgi:hypothetical protein